MKAVQILPVDFSDLQHGLEVICTTEGAERQGAVGVMLKDVGTLPSCSARDAFLAALYRVQDGGDVLSLPLLFADLVVVFSGWSAASYVDKCQREERSATGKKGGRPSTVDQHTRRAELVAAALARNPKLSRYSACKEVAKLDGVSVVAVQRSLKIVES